MIQKKEYRTTLSDFAPTLFVSMEIIQETIKKDISDFHKLKMIESIFEMKKLIIGMNEIKMMINESLNK